MRDLGKRNVLGVFVDALDYEAAVNKIIDAAKSRRAYSVSALAVHGVMTGVGDASHRYRLNHLDLVTPDGQPVRWALNLLYKTRLKDRVYGPTLMVKLCSAAAEEGLPIFLYGSRGATLGRLADRLKEQFPALVVAGTEPSKFRRTTAHEKEALVRNIKESGARITFVGLGCPKQEVFVHEYRDPLAMPVIAVGAAFDYHSGLVREPPRVIQRWGLQWGYRLMQDPRRLWKRYLLLNPAYLGLLLLQAWKIWKPNPLKAQPPEGEVLYG